ncbi:unnamed protein product [Amoebophrya sp. A120]|nr:unnamed protein product [Amoebophrya sp. A120]|eukprot:GSA120T00013719001.1
MLAMSFIGRSNSFCRHALAIDRHCDCCDQFGFPSRLSSGPLLICFQFQIFLFLSSTSGGVIRLTKSSNYEIMIMISVKAICIIVGVHLLHFFLEDFLNVFQLQRFASAVKILHRKNEGRKQDHNVATQRTAVHHLSVSPGEQRDTKSRTEQSESSPAPNYENGKATLSSHSLLARGRSGGAGRIARGSLLEQKKKTKRGTSSSEQAVASEHAKTTSAVSVLAAAKKRAEEGEPELNIPEVLHFPEGTKHVVEESEEDLVTDRTTTPTPPATNLTMIPEGLPEKQREEQDNNLHDDIAKLQEGGDFAEQARLSASMCYHVILPLHDMTRHFGYIHSKQLPGLFTKEEAEFLREEAEIDNAYNFQNKHLGDRVAYPWLVYCLPEGSLVFANDPLGEDPPRIRFAPDLDREKGKSEQKVLKTSIGGTGGSSAAAVYKMMGGGNDGVEGAKASTSSFLQQAVAASSDADQAVELAQMTNMTDHEQGAGRTTVEPVADDIDAATTGEEEQPQNRTAPADAPADVKTEEKIFYTRKNFFSGENEKYANSIGQFWEDLVDEKMREINAVAFGGSNNKVYYYAVYGKVGVHEKTQAKLQASFAPAMPEAPPLRAVEGVENGGAGGSGVAMNTTLSDALKNAAKEVENKTELDLGLPECC